MRKEAVATVTVLNADGNNVQYDSVYDWQSKYIGRDVIRLLEDDFFLSEIH
jgi:hypothetical protein